MQSNNIALYLKRKNRNNFLKSLGASGTILAMAATLLSQAIFPSIARADSPQFNIFTPYVHTQTFNRDYYLLDVKNETKGTDWNFPVSADQGDTLVFYLYYHNGIVNTMANNTTLKATLPSGVSQQHIVTGYLWADNATNASPSNPLTQTVQVNISSSQSLQYVAGSAKWFPDQGDWRFDAPTPFPSGQNENQLFSTGINIGSIEGCWEFSGAIVFKAKVSQIQYSATLTIDKKMRNLTNNETVWNDSVNAYPRQTIATQLIITNTGNTTANNIFVRDILPDRLLYNSGTTKIDNAATADGVTSGGINIGSLSPGQSKTVYFEGTLEREVRFVRGTTTLTNTGYARADQVNEIQDSANIVVTYTGCNPEMNRPPAR
ncbi:DUF11 domain-containing protein [Patescibacteria group bacterium]|nr:DUF11 domain-containing protein [Patescibacteria group bacterium]